LLLLFFIPFVFVVLSVIVFTRSLVLFQYRFVDLHLPQEAVVEVVGDAGGGDEGADEEGERQHEGQDERVGAGRAARP